MRQFNRPVVCTVNFVQKSMRTHRRMERMVTVVTSLLLLLLHGSCIDGRSAPLKTGRIMHESTVDFVQREKIDQKNARTREKKLVAYVAKITTHIVVATFSHNFLHQQQRQRPSLSIRKISFTCCIKRNVFSRKG